MTPACRGFDGRVARVGSAADPMGPSIAGRLAAQDTCPLPTGGSTGGLDANVKRLWRATVDAAGCEAFGAALRADAMDFGDPCSFVQAGLAQFDGIDAFVSAGAGIPGVTLRTPFPKLHKRQRDSTSRRT